MENPEIILDDETEKVIINAKGNRDGLSQEMNAFLDYLLQKPATSAFTKAIEEEVISAREHKKWSVEYMTMLAKINEERKEAKEEGREEGRLEAVREVARNMFKIGFSSEETADCTGLSLDEVRNIQEDIQTSAALGAWFDQLPSLPVTVLNNTAEDLCINRFPRITYDRDYYNQVKREFALWEKLEINRWKFITEKVRIAVHFLRNIISYHFMLGRAFLGFSVMSHGQWYAIASVLIGSSVIFFIRKKAAEQKQKK